MARYFTKDEKKFMRERELREQKASEEDSHKNFYRDAHDYKGLNQARYRLGREARSDEGRGKNGEHLKYASDYHTRRPLPERRYSERGRSRRRQGEGEGEGFDSDRDLDEPNYPGRYERHERRYARQQREPEYQDEQQAKPFHRGRTRERTYAFEGAEETEDHAGIGDSGDVRRPSWNDTGKRGMHKSSRLPKSPDKAIPGAFHYYSDNSEELELEHPLRRPRRPKQERAYTDGYQRKKTSGWF